MVINQLFVYNRYVNFETSYVALSHQQMSFLYLLFVNFIYLYCICEFIFYIQRFGFLRQMCLTDYYRLVLS